MKNLEIEIKHWPIARLSPSPTNPRTHSPEQVAQIAGSIQQFGFVNPILVGADGKIIAGEGRYRAALTLGMRKVPVIVLEHLSEVQRRALAIADNQLALNAGWDEQMLREQLAALQDENFDLDLLGFDDLGIGAAAGRSGRPPGSPMKTKFRRSNRPGHQTRRPLAIGISQRATHTGYCAATPLPAKTPTRLLMRPATSDSHGDRSSLWRRSRTGVARGGRSQPADPTRRQGRKRRSDRLVRGLGAVSRRRCLCLACGHSRRPR